MNSSITSGVFPDKLKEAIIFPLLKKSSLDHVVMKNYRPVSNIAFMSKVLELAVSTRLSSYLGDHDLREQFQSAYKPSHSTETALIRVKQDILQQIDQKRGALLVLLDLSAAFDTIDHSILLSRLQTEYGIKETALQWFTSYLTGRSSRVSMKGKYSETHYTRYGVPQGSVLGPRLFTMYIRPVGDIIKRHDLQYHLYADDTQIYCSFDPRNQASLDEACNKLETCIGELSRWMTSNMLKLNEDKSEIILLSSSRLRPSGDLSLQIGNATVDPSTTVKNLGQTLSMSEHVRRVCQVANFHMRNICHVKKYLTGEACSHAVRSLVLSRLDYGNSLLANVNAGDLKRLQKIQNRAARLVLGAKKREQLHWLPTKQRIEFKLALLVYKCLMHSAPHYLSIMITTPPVSRYHLRSRNDQTLLLIPRTNTKAAERSLSYAGLSTWNTLPQHLRLCSTEDTFKKKLKTQLFPS